MDATLTKLERLGLSSYESKAVLALLKKHPSNGYQVGKIAGIPTSKVYDVLGRLKNRGIVTADESVTPPLYHPVPVDALIGRLKSSYDAAIHELESDLKLITPNPELDLSWNLMGYHPEIRAAESRGVTVVLSLFGAARVSGSSCGVTAQKRLGARLMVIAADAREVIISGISDASDTLGIVTSTPQIVLIAKEYIRQDAWSRILNDEIGEERFNELCTQNELMSFLINNQ